MSGLDLTRRVMEIENQIETPQTVEIPAGVNPIGHSHSGYMPIINGDANIWQWGTSFAAIADATYFVDRFEYNKVGTMVHTVTQDSDVPTLVESSHQSNFSMKIDCTTADAVIAAGDYTYVTQKVEGYNFAPLAGKTAYLSFWVKGTKAGIHCVAFRNSTAAPDRSYVVEYTINTTDTWERKTITIPFDFTGGTWDYTTGIGLYVDFVLAAGSTFQTTADAWQNGNFFATANQVNACDNVANDFFLSQVQLRQDNPDIFIADRLLDEELAACQRYYQKTFDQAVTPVQNAGVWGLSGQVFSAAAFQTIVAWPYEVDMRAIPTLTTYNPFAADANMAISGAGSFPIAVYTSHEHAVYFRNTGAGLTVGGNVNLNATADAEL